MRLRMGMVGGGLDAMAGQLHRRAAALDSRVELVAGALSSTPERSLAAGKAWGLARSYGTWQEMLQCEAKLPAGERIEFVTVATPNHLHARISTAFAESGFHVACDKPIAISLEEARHLCRVVDRSGIVFLLTHNYTGYPMVKQARHMIATGELGKLVKVLVDYPQGWLLQPLENQGHKGAAWRTDPSMSGAAGCLADIGSHAQHMMHTVTGLEIEALCAELGHLHGRKVDDDISLLMRLRGGARGVLTASQVMAGEEGGPNFRIYGTHGALEWKQLEPESLLYRRPGAPVHILRRGEPYLCDTARRASRLPPGHPEGYYEAFGNLYRNFADAIIARREGVRIEEDFPTAVDGARTMAFIETALESNAAGGQWMRVKDHAH
ncbi:MAG TPA: Gfo/Idh/MocA family oxidoreductase [Burkholderiales bacterium]|nr:Gfo/Idh/MocA family oxidoreductase [Burkholderiales bacterium]